MKAVISTAILSLLLGTAACSEDAPSNKGEGARLELDVAALTLPGIVGAVYRITVRNGDPAPNNIVWQKTVDSRDYGTPQGDVTYIGPCDAAFDQNTVELELIDLYVLDDADLPVALLTTDYVNPAPLGQPIRRAFDCDENRDTLVELNLAIMRDADQGFFDIAVNFDDIFCSAKVDCAYPTGPIELLHDPETGERGPTMVVAFACTTGTDEENTYMYLSTAVISCADGTTYTLRPNRGPGNAGPRPDLVYQHGIYSGRELFPDMDKCFWNLAIGIDVAELAERDDCTLSMTGTASEELWTDGQTPTSAIWPVIDFDVDFRAVAGALSCNPAQNPLDGEGSGVTTSYTTAGPEAFRYALDCANEEVIEVGGNLCEGHLPTLAGEDITFLRGPGGTVRVEVGEVRSAASYTLPAGTLLGDTCLPDPCCDIP